MKVTVDCIQLLFSLKYSLVRSLSHPLFLSLTHIRPHRNEEQYSLQVRIKLSELLTASGIFESEAFYAPLIGFDIAT